MSNGPRYECGPLTDFARRLFAAAGLEGDKAQAVAEILVEGDLLGHDTHGLALAAPYLEEIAAGAMAIAGEPEIVADRGAVLTWDGGRLPGVWLTRQAVEAACVRARTLGIAAVAIRRSHHIGCLMAYLRPATAQGLMLLIATSDPGDRSVAPYGGRQALFTPDPLAVGIPTQGDPILIDISSSITTNAMTARLRREGRPFPGEWALDGDGRATTRPEALAADPPGTLLPAGGLDHGHKGYGLALAVEALSQGLAGHGRAEQPQTWGAGVYVQAFDPQLFAGGPAFLNETSWIAAACRANPPRPGVDRVRLPGERALAHRRLSLENGLELRADILPALRPWAERLAIAIPDPI